MHNDSSTSVSWRFRGRVELAYPLNRAKLTSEGTAYLTSDTERFVPISDDPQQGQVNQWRLRNGAGYRVNFSTRLEALYIRTTKKDEAGRFASESQAIDFRLKLAF